MAIRSWFRAPALRLYIFAVFASICAASQCYHEDGSVSSDSNVPCSNDSSQPSACCNQDAICLKNGLCLSAEQPFGLTRGSCTDSNGWLSPNCPQYCRKFFHDCCPRCGAYVSLSPGNWNQSGARIGLLSYTDGIALYCCNGIVVRQGVKTCPEAPDGSPQTPFQIDYGTGSSIVFGAAALAGVETASCPSSHVTQTQTHTHAPLPTQKPPQSSAQSSSSSHDVAIGAGVGVPLGVIALISIAWAMWERRKRHQAIQLSTSTQQPMEHRHRAVGVELPQPPNHGTGYAELDGSRSNVGVGTNASSYSHS